MTVVRRVQAGPARSWRATAHRLVGLRDRVLFSDTWASGWPVRTKHPGPGAPPFFVIGSPRSGTTLLRAILTRHPDLFIPPENGAIGKMIRAFGAQRSASWSVTVDAVLAAFRTGYEFDHWKLNLEEVARSATALPDDRRSLTELFELIYRSYGSIHAPGTSRWADKNVSGSCVYLDKISLVFPTCRYVHLVRDGRDCVASAMKAGMFGGRPETAAYGWKDSVNECRRLGRRLGPDQYFELRYENLVTDPTETVRALCDFLTLEPTPDMLDYAGTNDVADVNAIAHHGSVRKPLFESSVGAWKRRLPESDVRPLMQIIQSELALFDYK